MGAFDFVNSINTSKVNMMRDTENDAMAEKDYVPFLTNKSLSYFADSVLHANEMNLNHHLDNRPQYEFLLNSVRRRKRMSKWAKPVPSEIVDAICEVYECNKQVAEQYHSLLTADQIASVMQMVEKGGRKK